MMAGSHCLRSLIVAALLVAGALTPATAASWLEKGVYLIGPRYDGVLPPCEAALDTIASRFALKEGRFWNSNLQIVGFDAVRENICLLFRWETKMPIPLQPAVYTERIFQSF